MANNTNPQNPTSSTSSTSSTAAPKTESAAASPFPSFASFGAAFDPMAMWQTTQAQWTKLMTDAAGRAQSFADQYVALEGQMMTRAHDAIGTWAQLSQDALSYGVQMSTEARKVSIDAARKLGVSA